MVWYFLFDDVLFHQAPDVEAKSYPDRGNVQWLEEKVQWTTKFPRRMNEQLMNIKASPLEGGRPPPPSPPFPSAHPMVTLMRRFFFASYLCENTRRELCVICEKNVTRKSEMVRKRKFFFSSPTSLLLRRRQIKTEPEK